MCRRSLLYGLVILCLCTTPRTFAADPAARAGGPSAPAVGLGEPAPITVWNRTIIMLRASYEGSTPADRARRAVARIEALPPRPGYDISTIEASSKGVKGLIVKTRTETLFALLPEDVASDEGQTLEAAAQAAVDRLKTALDERAGQMKWSRLAHGAGFAAAATILYGLLLWAVARLRRTVVTRIEGRITKWRRELAVAGINLLPVLRFLGRVMTQLGMLTVFVTTTYLWLTFCFSRFFYTQPWADQLGDYLAGFLKFIALGIVAATPGLLTVLVICWLTRIVTSAVSRFFEGVQQGRIAVGWLQPDSARASRRIVIAVIWLFALTIAYPYIPGSGSDAFKGVSVFTGLMFSLGATGFINHVMSGLVIAYSGAMRVGDVVTINDVVGVVEELGLMSTKIATPKKEYVSIPNGVVIGGHVINYSRLAAKEGIILSTVVTIGYDAPWRQVHALLLQAAQKTAGIRKTPAPFVLQTALSDFYVTYDLRFAIDQPMQRLSVLSDIHAAIQDAFNEAGVQIMSPHFEAQPEKAVVVAKSQWHVSPEAQETKDVAAG